MPPLAARSLIAVAAVAAIGGCTARFVATGRVRATPATAAPAAAPTPAPPIVTPTQPPPIVTSPVQIAGTPVVRVGINFEDQGAGGDADYNDAVMCFTGNFKVDGSTVISTEAQDVVATTSSISDCHHQVTVQIVHPDGRATSPIVFRSNAGAQVPMRFELGSRLEVAMQSITGGCSPVGRTMHEPAWARVQLDRCNTTGR